MTKPSPATLLATESHTFFSKLTGKTYQISIALPYTYLDDNQKGGPFFRYPDSWHAVYLTDANWHFGMVTEFVRESAWCGRSWDAIIVGINYPESDTPQESWRHASALRADDLTPIQSAAEEADGSEWLNRPVKTGGGENFLAFLKQELSPWVEQHYRADPARRILVGHSYGGLFALYAMFQDPAFFRTYLAASPYLKADARSIFDVEAEYANTHTDLPAQLYLSAGELETGDGDPMLPDMERIAATLASHNYPNLSITQQIFADNNHCEVVAPSLHAGLKLALKR